MKIPKHIAFIMDGNGRWAKEKKRSRTFGHRAGFKNLVDVVKACKKIGVEVVTCYAFSTENWNRPEKEVKYLMEVPVEMYYERVDEFIKEEIKVRFIGRRDRFPADTLKAIEDIEEKTNEFTDFQVVVAFDYGAYDEIITAIKNVALDAVNGKIDIDDINESLFEDYLFTKNLPSIDLMVRTSGENRLSNFLLWQLAYSELYFPRTYWPDFKEKELKKAIEVYNNRKRRFGAIEEE